LGLSPASRGWSSTWRSSTAARIQLSSLASVFLDGAHVARVFDQLRALFDRGVLTPPAIKTWSLEESAEAYQTVLDGSARIKQVLLPTNGEA
jgi:hypothetical protein